MFPRPVLIATLMLTAAVSAASSQTAGAGRADLRYVAPMPATLTYVGIDSMDMKVGGMPTGDMTMTGYTRTRVDVSLTPSKDSVRVRVEVKELTGEAQTPMGTMPIGGQIPPAVEVMLTHKGLDPKQDFGSPAGMGLQEIMGQGANYSAVPFAQLPGRALAIGEEWTDTLEISRTIEGITVNVNTIIHGTYSRDTVVDGRTLNVLDFRNSVTMKSDGTTQGMAIKQTMETTSQERVLWDSVRHIVVSRTADADMVMNATMPGMGEMRTTGKVTSHKRIVE